MSQLKVFVAAAAVLISAAASNASLVSLTATHDGTQPNFFTLNFAPELGGPRSGQISTTDFTLSYDEVAGTAQFDSYLQHIDSIELPGGIPTGEITVTIVPGSSSGAFNSATGEFSTNELYSISFTNPDLIIFGLESPVIMPSSSAGLIDFTNSRIGQNWSGIGQIGNPIDPKTPINFDYVCVVNTTFVPEPAVAAMLALGGLLLRRRR